MSYLADTCALLWFAREPARLSRRALRILEDTSETVYFSVASAWEVAVKVSLGKLRLDTTVAEFVAAQRRNDFRLLPIEISHVTRVAELPWHHRDPFDRMLIAQGLEENLEIITADPAFGKYPGRRIW